LKQRGARGIPAAENKEHDEKGRKSS
jgi:hypothetical protein